MRLRKHLLAGVCVLVLAGCDFAPDYQPPNVETPVAFKETGNWQPAQPADAIPKGAWWTIYGDDTLNKLEAQVDSGNPDLAAASAAYDKARDFAAEAESGLYPQIGMGGNVSTNHQSGDRPLRSSTQPNYYGDNSLDVRAAWEPDFWGRIHDAAESGKAEAQASAADLETVRLSLHAELASDYVTLRGLDDEAKLLDDTTKAYQQAYDMTQQLFKGKLASDMDVSRAETQLDDAQAQSSDITARRALLEHAIATLTGKPPSAVTIASAVLHIAIPNVPTGLPSDLLQRRPDIASAERQVAAANQMIGVAQAAFYPDISIGATGGFNATTLDLLELPHDFWSVGPAMTLPLFEGGLRHAKLGEAKASFEEATDRYRSTVLGAFQEIEDNLALLHWLEKEETQEQAAAKAAKQTLDMSMSLYRNGADSYLDVVTSQTAALASQRAVLVLQTRQIQASIGLVRALGGGWSTEQLPKAETVADINTK